MVVLEMGSEKPIKKDVPLTRKQWMMEEMLQLNFSVVVRMECWLDIM